MDIIKYIRYSIAITVPKDTLVRSIKSSFFITFFRKKGKKGKIFNMFKFKIYSEIETLKLS